MVQYRNGCFRFVGKNGYLKDGESEVVSSLMDYNAHLEHIGNEHSVFDIVAVYELKEVWKREELTITEDEKAILRNLPAEYKWITRDKNGELYLYQGKPEKGVDVWMSKLDHRSLGALSHLFLMVEWEDDEPWNTEDLLNLDVKNL